MDGNASGMKNSPSVHQRRVNDALRDFIGKICHIYLDDIIIWSQSLEEHQEHVKQIMEALRKERLYCNARKSEFFKYELKFLVIGSPCVALNLITLRLHIFLTGLSKNCGRSKSIPRSCPLSRILSAEPG